MQLPFKYAYSIKIINVWAFVLVGLILNILIFALLSLTITFPSNDFNHSQGISFFVSLVLCVAPYQLVSIAFLGLLAFGLRSYATQFIVVILTQLISFLLYFKFLPSGMLMNYLRRQQVFALPNESVPIDFIPLIIALTLVFSLGGIVMKTTILKRF